MFDWIIHLIIQCFDNHLNECICFQLLLVDGDRLREDPNKIMNTVQQFLKIEPFDYSKKLKYDHVIFIEY